MGDELFVLVRREGIPDGVDDDPVELRALHPRHRQLVDVREVPLAEFAIAVDVELLVGELAVPGKLLVVAEVGAIGDSVVLPPCRGPRSAAGP